MRICIDVKAASSFEFCLWSTLWMDFDKFRLNGRKWADFLITVMDWLDAALCSEHYFCGIKRSRVWEWKVCSEDRTCTYFQHLTWNWLFLVRMSTEVLCYLVLVRRRRTVTNDKYQDWSLNAIFTFLLECTENRSTQAACRLNKTPESMLVPWAKNEMGWKSELIDYSNKIDQNLTTISKSRHIDERLPFHDLVKGEKG